MPWLQKAKVRLLFVTVLVLVLVQVQIVLDGGILKPYTESKANEEVIDDATLMPVDVPINTNSTIEDDLLTIVHHPQTSKIAVHLQSGSRCTHPYLMGRLSGPLLSKLSWDKPEPPSNHTMNHHASNRIVTGRYQVPKGGRYFLEILLLMCDPVAQDTCLEDPGNHRLTAKGAAIDIAHTTNTTAIGYWYSKLTNASDHEPLYTRYQPSNCRGGQALTPRCQVATDLSRFKPYRFAFEGAYGNLTRKSLKQRLLKLSERHTMCFVGKSHAQLLSGTSMALLGSVIIVKLVEVKFPELVNQAVIDELFKKKCTKVVLGFGQWDAGWPRHYLTPFKDYERVLGDAARWFTASPVSDNMDVVFRRTHYNPIGDFLQCLPNKAHDWRNPPVIDKYNSILRTVCDRHGLEFLDTGGIMSTVWDSAADWCHYSDKGSSRAEALYILDQLFK